MKIQIYTVGDLLNCNTHQTTLKNSKELPSDLHEMYFETCNFCLKVLIKAIHVPGHFPCSKVSSPFSCFKGSALCALAPSDHSHGSKR